MNIQQFIDNPQLIETLTPQQKVQLFTSLQNHQKQLQQEQTRLQTELEIKQKEQQDLFKQLQDQTHKQTLPEIKQFIDDLQQQFTQELTSIVEQYHNINKKEASK